MTEWSKSAIVFVLAFFSLASMACPVLASSVTAPDGHLRHYEISIPDQLRGRTAPVLFVLHGGGGSAAQIHRHWAFDRLARKHGFVVVYPDGLEHHWNDGRTGGSRRLFKRAPPDDAGFLRALAARLVADDIADRARIYVAGVSNGGMMTQRLACEASDVFAGFASLIANLPASLEACQPARARPLLMINGDADPLMPWQGGGVGFKGKRGKVLSGPQSFAHWRRAFGCTGKVRAAPVANMDTKDKARPRLLLAAGCPEGITVQMVQILGGGHAVPGAPYRRKMLRRILGHTSMDFDARKMVVRFFGL